MADSPVIDHSVYRLQTMLRAISYCHPELPRLTPDGYFGERTLEAVMRFQKKFHPPVTGVVDHGTWCAIAAGYQRALQGLLPPSPCACFPHRRLKIKPGQQSIHLYLIQAMFLALSKVLQGVEAGPVSGMMDEVTAGNTRWLQQQCQCPVTGVFDLSAWEALAGLYTLCVTQKPDSR